MKTRAISKTMKNALITGTLSGLLKAVQMDDTLDLELRGDSVNIYYRGSSIFKITEHKNKTNNTSAFTIFFDTNYGTSFMLNAKPSPTEAVENLPFYKQAMDLWFHAHPKYEREFQQIIARENNNVGKISNGTDYFIADIEFADEDARFDMVALKWPSFPILYSNASYMGYGLYENQMKHIDSLVTKE